MNTFNFPPEAYIPENDLWINILKKGLWTPGNTGIPQEWDNPRLTNVSLTTNQAILEGNYPTINIDHVRKGPAYGLIDAVRFKEGQLDVRVAYLTKEIVEELKAGKYPYRSAEIIKEGDKEIIAGIAFLGSASPAVKGLDPLDYRFTLNKSQQDNAITVLQANELTEETTLLKDETSLERENKENSLDFQNYTQEEIQLMMKQHDKLKQEIEEYKKEINDQRKQSQMEDLKRWIGALNIPKDYAGDILTIATNLRELSDMQQYTSTKTGLSEKPDFMQLYEIFCSFCEHVSALYDKLYTEIILSNEVEYQFNKMYDKMLGYSNPEAIDHETLNDLAMAYFNDEKRKGNEITFEQSLEYISNLLKQDKNIRP